MEIKVLKDQSLFDIAIIAAGSADAAFDLAEENNLSMTDELTPGQIITYNGNTNNSKIVEYYKNNNINPATGLSEDLYVKIFDYFFDEYFE